MKLLREFLAKNHDACVWNKYKYPRYVDQALRDEIEERLADDDRFYFTPSLIFEQVKYLKMKRKFCSVDKKVSASEGRKEFYKKKELVVKVRLDRLFLRKSLLEARKKQLQVFKDNRNFWSNIKVKRVEKKHSKWEKYCQRHGVDPNSARGADESVFHRVGEAVRTTPVRDRIGEKDKDSSESEMED